MAKRLTAVAVSKLPNGNCLACHGMGTIHMTASFAAGVQEFDWPCWECFGADVRLPLPKPRSIDNA